jgi:hypothetical protein
MTATCTIRHPGGTRVFDAATGLTTTTPLIPFYSGVCRVQALAVGDNRADVAGQQVSSAGYLITVPWSVDEAEVDDLVTVTASGDGSLTGRTLTVTTVQRGSLRFERDLICLDDLG